LFWNRVFLDRYPSKMLSVINPSTVSIITSAYGSKRDGRPSPSPPHKHTFAKNFQLPILIGKPSKFIFFKMLKNPFSSPPKMRPVLSMYDVVWMRGKFISGYFWFSRVFRIDICMSDYELYFGVLLTQCLNI